MRFDSPGYIDIAQDICSTEHLGAPDDIGDAMHRLGLAGIVDPATASATVSAVGFRNVLVHVYVAVDDAMVVRQLGDHHDLADFTRQVSTWLRLQL